MEAYAKALTIAIPGFILLIIIEWLYGKYVKGEVAYDGMDTIASLTSGTTNTLKSILGLTFIIIGYSWVHSHIALFELPSTPLVIIIAFICVDFASYWGHRLNHSINYFWNHHVVHHSSEEFNLACALRQTIGNIFSIGGLFLIPAAILGVDPAVIGLIAPIHLFAQFWYHTRHIGKLGFLEYIIVTPSQHRVHHAINEIYLDKNLAAIFCVWDRIFGTFQEELDEVPCVYGVKRQPSTWNPFKINYQHLWQLIKDAWHANSYWDKLRIWFMPLGWRPADVATQHPIKIVEDPYTMVKYAPPITGNLKAWSWFQFVISNVFMTHFLLNVANIPLDGLLMYGLFLSLMIYAYTALMDQDRFAFLFEVLKVAFGIGVIVYSGGWFGADQTTSIVPIVVAGYLVISLGVVGYFSFREERVEVPSDSSVV